MIITRKKLALLCFKLIDDTAKKCGRNLSVVDQKKIYAGCMEKVLKKGKK